MELAGTMDGSSPILKKIRVGSTVSNIGTAMRCTSGNSGVVGAVPCTTTNANDFLGISQDTAQYSAARPSDGSDPSVHVTVIVNPSAVFRARLYGGATESAMQIAVVDTAQTDGLSVAASGTHFGNPAMDSGFIFGYTGINAGRLRKITTPINGAAVVSVPFPSNSQVGDEYLYGPFCGVWGRSDQFATLSTDATAVNSNIAESTTADNFRVIEFELKTAAEEGSVSSHVILAPFDHVFSNSGSVLRKD